MRQLLDANRAGRDWRNARHSVFRDGSFGNGSAMRVGPLGAYLHDAPADEVVAQADVSAEITHSHPEGRAGAVAVALAAWLAARTRGAGLRTGGDGLPPDTPLSEAVVTLGNGSRISCPDTVPLALWLALHHLDGYERAVRRAIAACGDTDTTAAIVGSIVAAHAGPACIPQRWLAAVEPIPAG